MTRARPPWLPDERYPFADHYAEVAGCDVHYVDEGAGPPMLLLHGNPALGAAVPDHRTVMLEGAGHYIQEEKPDEIVAAIRAM